jgi:hypothetical protein
MMQSSGGSGKANEITDDLPDEIVQPLVEFGRALLTHARAHRDQSLAEHEDGVLAAWRGAAPELLEAVLQVATTGLETNVRLIAARCPASRHCRLWPRHR